MNLRRIFVGNLITNCYLMEFSDRIVLVDPGDMPEKLLRACGDLPISDILLTHGHLDHTGAIGDLCDRFDCRVWMHEADKEFLNDDTLRAPASPAEPWWRHDLKVTNFIQDGEKILLGDGNEQILLRVIHTPGHTPGSVCFHMEEQGILFSGDTLFKGAEGRTDFPGGDHAAIKESLKKLSTLPLPTSVYPGHGFGTNIGAEDWIRGKQA